MKWLGKFEIQSHDADFQRIAKASSLVKYMQEAARKQLEVSGPTEKDMAENHAAFVLCRLTLAIYSPVYPDSEALVETWACPSNRISYPRNTKMYVNDKMVAELAGVWTAIDTTATRKFVRMGEVLDKIAEDEELSLDVDPRFKIPADINLSLVGEYNVGYSVCDVNHHMNNVRYIDMFSDYIIGGLNGKRITNADITFVNEAPMGDFLKIYASREVDDGKYYFRAYRGDGKVCAEAMFILDRI